MISPRFNLIEQLNIISAAKPSKESVKNMDRSFSRGDIPDTFVGCMKSQTPWRLGKD
jgi:hypothetical protein